jgi:hypothetical protein
VEKVSGKKAEVAGKQTATSALSARVFSLVFFLSHSIRDNEPFRPYQTQASCAIMNFLPFFQQKKKLFSTPWFLRGAFIFFYVL